MNKNTMFHLVTATDYLVWGVVCHLIADWVFQNRWMAQNKSSPKHPAAWVHGLIHFFAMLPVFPVFVAAGIAFAHILIDTRLPVRGWQKLYRQTADGPYAIHVQIWLDQVFHVIVIAIAALIVA